MTAPQKTLTMAGGALVLAAGGMCALYWREWGAQLTGATLVAVVAVGLLLVIVANVQRWQERDECRAVKPPDTPAPDWDGADGQLRLAVYAAKRAGMSTPMIAQLVAHECAEYSE